MGTWRQLQDQVGSARRMAHTPWSRRGSTVFIVHVLVPFRWMFHFSLDMRTS